MRARSSLPRPLSPVALLVSFARSGLTPEPLHPSHRELDGLEGGDPADDYSSDGEEGSYDQ